MAAKAPNPRPTYGQIAQDGLRLGQPLEPHPTARTWYASRKFRLAAALTLLIAPAFLAFNKITADQWVNLTQWLFGMYLGSNVASKLTPGQHNPPRE